MGNESICSGIENGSCKYGHATTGDCFGYGYPDGAVVPVCVRDDKQINQKTQTVGIKLWRGE